MQPHVEHIDPEALEKLISTSKSSGGAELANAQPFIIEFCNVLGLPAPDLSQEENRFNDYVFERRVNFKHPNGTTSHGRIDCYKRDCFVLEAKQSAKRKRDGRNFDKNQLDMLGEDHSQRKTGTAKRGTGGWDKSMRAARKQAEDYARALPVEHGYPPFLLIVDVGNVIEVYADFSGQGKNYAQFPDRKSYRISMDDLRDADIQMRLRTIWTDPQSLNPALISAKVTRDIAERLAKIAKRLEGKHPAEEVAHFLMRCLFTMFAEDVELIEPHSFENLLKDLIDQPETFPTALQALWTQMDKGGYDMRTMKTIRHFNGGLFADCRALPLDSDSISELWIAAKRDWSDVEPAIFGTLLEQALDPRERGKLGAHYTPRAYVERLVIPTIIEPLREDWDGVQARAQELHDAGDDAAALKAVRDFHHTLCTTRVLDPACGTGNFLYVSLELMKRLEGEVLETMDDLGLADPKLAMEGETVTPRQFYGLDLNERAVAIADLVLWLGYIKWQLKTSGIESITDPVLEKLGNIKHQDAILAYDSKTLALDEDGKPISRWNGYTYKIHPITGNDVPDPDARVEAYEYKNPRRARWPIAEFIVGNPPFIGGGAMRSELGDGYAESVWNARGSIPAKADFVMQFWDEAAQILSQNPSKANPNALRRFGFITTNSITQTFSRRVVEVALTAKSPISLVFAVADHPWMKSSDKASVRIAMTVAERGSLEGVLGSVLTEKDLDTDTPDVELEKMYGQISAKLTVGADMLKSDPLIANDLLCRNGMMLAGSGFKLTTDKERIMGKKYLPSGLVKEYVSGSDLTKRISGTLVIDGYISTAERIAEAAPQIYAHLIETVKPHRDNNRRKSFQKNWWMFGEPRRTFRPALNSIVKYVATTETTKHRFFQFLDANILPDHMVVAVAIPFGWAISTLSSRVHWEWVKASAASLGVFKGPSRYTKTKTFDPFPFPACVTDDSNTQLRDKLSDLGERLDAHRKSVMEKYDFLTMTGMYNVLERVRELEAGVGEPLSESEHDIYDAALIAILKEIHDDIDRATLEAYGWSDLAPALVGKVGATLPSPHKSPEQEAAEEELLTRLVALNIERREEERRGHVRWLRPDYQIPKLGHKVKVETQDMDIAPIALDTAPAWPKDGLDQIKIVRELLAKSEAPMPSTVVAAVFKGRNTDKRKTRVSDVLETLVSAGIARVNESENAYYLPR